MIMNVALFPRLKICSLINDNKFWKDHTDLGSEQSLEKIIDHIETEFIEAKRDVDVMRKLATAFVEDILEYNESQETEKRADLEILDFMQFQVSSLILSFLTQNNLMDYSFEWIVNAIDDKINDDKQREVGFLNLEHFITSAHPYIRSHFHRMFSSWIHDLFYYSRCTGGHVGGCKIVLNLCLDWHLQSISETPDIMGVRSISQILTWCSNYSLTKEVPRISEMLFNIYNNAQDRAVKKNIAYQFCLMNRNYTPVSKRNWCTIVQNEFSDLLSQHEPFQLLVNSCENDYVSLSDHLENLISAIQYFAKHYTGQGHGLHAYHFNRIFSILTRSIFTLLKNGNVQSVNSLVGAYFNIPSPGLRSPEYCCIIPNDTTGVLYCFERDTIFVDSDTRKNIPKIIRLGNQFLGLTNALNDDPEFILEIPERPGVPNADMADEFAAAISGHFNFRKMRESNRFRPHEGYFLVNGIQFPLQNIIACEIDYTLPIIHSFQKPLPERKIKTAFTWQGDTLMAEYECQGIEEIFRFFHISTHVSTHLTSTKEEFLSNYNDPEYDMVWIICHGEYAHFEAHKSYLDLGSGISVKIEDLSFKPGADFGRRLLFIDACDGATTSLANSPLSIGIGTSAISRHQSLLSNVWPVDNHSSMIMSLLIAIFLSEGENYPTAHCKSIQLFRKGKEIILSVLSKYIQNGDLMERIINKELDFNNFIHWGALNYME